MFINLSLTLYRIGRKDVPPWLLSNGIPWSVMNIWSEYVFNAILTYNQPCSLLIYLLTTCVIKGFPKHSINTRKDPLGRGHLCCWKRVITTRVFWKLNTPTYLWGEIAFSRTEFYNGYFFASKFSSLENKIQFSASKMFYLQKLTMEASIVIVKIRVSYTLSLNGLTKWFYNKLQLWRVSRSRQLSEFSFQ